MKYFIDLKTGKKIKGLNPQFFSATDMSRDPNNLGVVYSHVPHKDCIGDICVSTIVDLHNDDIALAKRTEIREVKNVSKDTMEYEAHIYMAVEHSSDEYNAKTLIEEMKHKTNVLSTDFLPSKDYLDKINSLADHIFSHLDNEGIQTFMFVDENNITTHDSWLDQEKVEKEYGNRNRSR